MPDTTQGKSSRGTRRPLFAAGAVGLLIALGAWAASPRAVDIPSARAWAACFEPAALPPLPAGTPAREAVLVRHKSLDAPLLAAVAAEAAGVRLEGWQPPRTTSGAPAGQRAVLRAGQSVVLPAGATWAVVIERGFVELRQADGSRFLVGPNARFSLDPAEAYTARLATAVEVGAVAADGQVQLPKGTRVEIVLPEGDPTGAGVAVARTERLLVAPLVLASTASALAPDVRPDRETAPYLAAGVAAPGLDLDPSKRTLRACLWLGERQPKPIPITQVGTSGIGAAELVLGLPDEPFPWLDWRRGRLGALAVADADGRYAGIGRFVYPSRFWAFVIATGITGGLLAWLLQLRNAKKTWKRWAMELFLGDDGQPSLSLFQILLWTVVTTWALLFVFFGTGNLLAVTQQVMILLGFAGAGSLAARWVASGQPSPPRKTDEEGGARFWAMLESGANFDLFKLQLFLFTLLIALYVVFRVVQRSAFPTIDPEFLLLMGVSNGLYVGSKAAQSGSGAQQVDGLSREISDLEEQITDLASKMAATDPPTKRELANRQAELGKRLDDARGKVTALGKRLEDAGAGLASARPDRDAGGAAYKEAVSASAKG